MEITCFIFWRWKREQLYQLEYLNCISINSPPTTPPYPSVCLQQGGIQSAILCKHYQQNSVKLTQQTSFYSSSYIRNNVPLVCVTYTPAYGPLTVVASPSPGGHFSAMLNISLCHYNSTLVLLSVLPCTARQWKHSGMREDRCGNRSNSLTCQYRRLLWDTSLINNRPMSVLRQTTHTWGCATKTCCFLSLKL